MVVVFPAPFGPKKPWIVFFCTFRFSLFTAVKEPKHFVRSVVSIA